MGNHKGKNIKNMTAITWPLWPCNLAIHYVFIMYLTAVNHLSIEGHTFNVDMIGQAKKESLSNKEVSLCGAN